MRRISVLLLFLTQTVWASDPARPATDAEIEAKDSKIEISMNLESVNIKGKKAKDKFYNDFFAAGRDYLPCIDRRMAKPLKFEDSRLKALFSISKSKKGDLNIRLSFLPDQKDDEATSCLKERLKDMAKEISSFTGKITGEMVFKYSRPIKYDSVN